MDLAVFEQPAILLLYKLFFITLGEAVVSISYGADSQFDYLVAVHFGDLVYISISYGAYHSFRFLQGLDLRE